MTLAARILVVDDDPAQREPLAGFLRDLGADVDTAGDGRAALERLRAGSFDVVVSDVRMPGVPGPELLREIKRVNPTIEVLLVTAYGTVQEAVACLKDGAADYLLKPLDLATVEHVVRRGVERRHLRRENAELRRRLGARESLPGIVTGGGPMAEVLSTLARVAATDVSVLLLGESGTGKELLARALHAASRRAPGPFQAVNAAALSSTLLESELFGHERGAFTGADRRRIGRIEAAQGGTLFLDEIGDMPADVQMKLLRVLQERQVERVGSNLPIPVDVRVVAATHRDLPQLVIHRQFRDDLYYRLAVVTLEVPPLRGRRADIPLLVEHFLEKYASAVGAARRVVSREAMDLLVAYDYPGNVRELENIVLRAMALARGDLITTADLPASVRDGAAESGDPHGSPDSLPGRVAALERAMIDEALGAEEGNQSRAATRLGISERALRYKLAKRRGEDSR